MCFRAADIRGQLEYARHVCLGLHCMEDVSFELRGLPLRGSSGMQGMWVCAYTVRKHVDQEFISLSLGPLCLKIQNCGCGLHPSHSLTRRPKTHGAQSLCYCRHAAPPKLHQLGCPTQVGAIVYGERSCLAMTLRWVHCWVSSEAGGQVADHVGCRCGC